MRSFQHFLYTALQVWTALHIPVPSDLKSCINRKADGEDKTKERARFLQGRLTIQPLISIPELLFYQQRSSSQQWACRKEQNCLILGMSPGTQSNSLEMGTEGKLWQYSMKHEGEPWFIDVSEPITENLCKVSYIAIRINLLTYNLSLLPCSGAREHLLNLLMESLTESRARFLQIFRHCSNHCL